MDSEGSRERTGLQRRRLSSWIMLLFLGSALIVLGRLIISYIGVTRSPGQETPDLQPRIDQSYTEQAQFITEVARINITETAVAAIATARPFTETAYAPTREAYQTVYVVTQTAYAPTYEAFQTASVATQTAYAPTAKALQTIYPPTYEALQTAYSATETIYAPTREALHTASIITATAYAPTGEALQTAYVATWDAFPAYASTAKAMGTTTVQPPIFLMGGPNYALAYFPPPSSGGFDAADLAKSETENLDKGRYLFNAPSEMIAGNKYRVELRIVRDTQGDSYLMSASAFTADLQSQGTPQVEKTEVGKLMKAKLTASDFAITALNEEEQIILGQNYTQWAWDVMPRKAGDLDLNLTISMKVIYEGEEGLYDHPVITKKIFVRVNPAYSFQAFANDNWQWLMGTIVLPFLAWLWKKMRDQETGGKKKQGSLKKTKKQGSD